MPKVPFLKDFGRYPKILDYTLPCIVEVGMTFSKKFVLKDMQY